MHLFARITKNRRIKLFLANFLTLLISCALCFAVLEYGLARYYQSDVNQISYKQFDPELGWINRPGNYSIKPVQSLLKNSFYVNKYGLRNRDISPTKNNPAQRRIIILGDSFTFANSISDQVIFPSQLESILNSNTPGKYEIINAGVEGYGNVQELLLMKRLAADGIIGDVYVLMLFTNDILDNLCLSYDGARENVIQPKYELDANNKLALKRAPQNMIDDSSNLISVKQKRNSIILFDTLKIQIQLFLQTQPYLISILNKIGFNVEFARVPGLISGWYDKDVLQRGMPVLKQSIKEIRNEAEKLNAKLYISLIPSPLQVYPNAYGPLLKKTFPNNALVEKWHSDKWVPQRLVREVCEELQVPFLDLYPVLYENNNEKLYIPGDGHFTKEGHAIVAESLADFLRSYQPESKHPAKPQA